MSNTRNDADLAIRIPVEMHNALKQLATSELSSISNVARGILLDGLRAKNLLIAQPDPTDTKEQIRTRVANRRAGRAK